MRPSPDLAPSTVRLPPVRSLGQHNRTVSAERTDAELVSAVVGGDLGRFEELVCRYQARLFSLVRRHARREDEVEDIVQDIFLKAFSKLSTWRGDAPFEHWLMRLAVRTCYDVLRGHQRNREHSVTDLGADGEDWLERQVERHEGQDHDAEAARTLIFNVLQQLSPSHRLIITLLEIEERSVREIADLTGWSIPLVKVRAFRARAEMRRVLSKMTRNKYL